MGIKLQVGRKAAAEVPSTGPDQHQQPTEDRQVEGDGVQGASLQVSPGQAGWEAGGGRAYGLMRRKLGKVKGVTNHGPV